MYHAGWAWAGDTPFHHTKLVASHFGGTRNPLVDLLAGAHQARQDAAVPVPPRERHRADASTSSSASRRRRSWTASSRTRSTASAWPTPSPTRRRRGASRRSTSTTTAAAASTATAGTPARSARSSPGCTVGPGLTRLGLEQGRLGALRPHDGLLAGERPGRRRSPQRLADDAGAVPERRPRRTRSSRSARASGCAFTPRTGSRRPTRAGRSTRRRRGCPSSRRPGSAARATG